MIGAMPAVAVRHERRKQEKRGRRPSQLQLGGLKGHVSPPSRGASPSPSPQSPPSVRQAPEERVREVYACGKISVLHLVVVSLLLGAILLIVGLVQLKPGADASDHRYALLGSGGVLLIVGAILAGIRCWLLPWQNPPHSRSGHLQRDASSGIAPPTVTSPTPTQQQHQNQSNGSTITAFPVTTIIEDEVAPASISSGPQSVLLTSPSEHDALLVSTTSAGCRYDPEKACMAES